MYNSKIIGHRLGSGCWSSFCNNSKNSSCVNLSGKILSSSVLFRTSVNYKTRSIKKI